MILNVQRASQIIWNIYKVHDYAWYRITKQSRMYETQFNIVTQVFTKLKKATILKLLLFQQRRLDAYMFLKYGYLFIDNKTVNKFLILLKKNI